MPAIPPRHLERITAGWSLVLAALLVVAAGCTDSLVRGRSNPDDEPDSGYGFDVGGFDVADAGVPTADIRPDDATVDASTYPGPPYPIVLAHGFAGFDHLADVDGLAYYVGVKKALEEAGETVVIGEVDPFNDSTDRGEQLIDEVEAHLEN